MQNLFKLAILQENKKDFILHDVGRLVIKSKSGVSALADSVVARTQYQPYQEMIIMKHKNLSNTNQK